VNPSGAMIDAQQNLTDYHRIRVSPWFGKMRPNYTRAANAHACRWLAEAAARATHPLVIVTHHAPNLRSVAPCHESDALTPAYASSLDHLVEQTNADLWIHGHIHYPSDYRIGGVRVVCNPRGYGPDDLVDGFKPESAHRETTGRPSLATSPTSTA
jgi:hypothetical protein